MKETRYGLSVEIPIGVEEAIERATDALKAQLPGRYAPLTVALPDLVQTGITAPPADAAPGGRFTLTDTLQNTSTADGIDREPHCQGAVDDADRSLLPSRLRR